MQKNTMASFLQYSKTEKQHLWWYWTFTCELDLVQQEVITIGSKSLCGEKNGSVFCT
jgi:hypothetical protein